MTTPKATRNQIARLRAEFGNQCHYCRLFVYDEDATRDHIVPRCQSGPSVYENLVLACFPCNNRLDDELVKCDCDRCVSARAAFGALARETA